VRALPCVCFHLMNTINGSTGFSPFQLHLGCSSCMLPTLLPTNPSIDDSEHQHAYVLLSQLMYQLRQQALTRIVHLLSYSKPVIMSCLQQSIVIGNISRRETNVLQSSYHNMMDLTFLSMHTQQLPHTPLIYQTLPTSSLHSMLVNCKNMLQMTQPSFPHMNIPDLAWWSLKMVSWKTSSTRSLIREEWGEESSISCNGSVSAKKTTSGFHDKNLKIVRHLMTGRKNILKDSGEGCKHDVYHISISLSR
jgi:hypothetical protein